MQLALPVAHRAVGADDQRVVEAGIQQGQDVAVGAGGSEAQLVAVLAQAVQRVLDGRADGSAVEANGAVDIEDEVHGVSLWEVAAGFSAAL